jgi:HSP20 family molecular chaperone IbpA
MLPLDNASHMMSEPVAGLSQLSSASSPLIREESDGKTLRLRFNVSGYSPEEVTVKTVDNRLIVHALHEEKAPGKSVHREFNQDFTLPYGTNPEAITSSLSVDGVLTVEAPVPQRAITQ